MVIANPELHLWRIDGWSSRAAVSQGGSFSIWVSPKFLEIAKTTKYNEEKTQARARAIIKEAGFKHIEDYQRFLRFGEFGLMHFDVPGNACGLDFDYSEDFDGNGDACDFYDNNSGIEYAAGDLKSDDPNDMDGDGLTDGEDEDEDGDGLTGTAEKCAGVWDPKQKDSDFDKVPDSCDDNDDGDKLSDADESKNYLQRWWYPEKSVDVPRAECGLPVAPDESGGVPPLNDNGVNLASPNNIERMEGSGGSWSNTSGCNGNISGAEASFSLHNFAQLIFFALPALVIFRKRKTSKM